MFARLFLIAVLAACVAFAQPPTPTRPPGVFLGNLGAQVRLDVYYDHLCSDSAPNWPIIKNLISTYGSKLLVVLHIFPLPYHHNAFFAAWAGQFVRQSQNATQFVDYLELMFANQDQFLAAAANLNEGQVKDAMATLVSSKLPYTKAAVLAGLNDASLNMKARIDFKHATTQGIYGTPNFQVNGIQDEDADSYTLSQWKQLIQSLL